MMRVIITGGTGLIGQALADFLLESGHEVVILSRKPKTKHALKTGLTFAKWDARTSEGWGHWISSDTVIINLAGANLAGEGFFPTRWTSKRRRIIQESRLNASQAVLTAIAEAPEKPKLVMQSSAVGYYGYHLTETFIESSSPGTDWAATFTSQAWEPSTQAVQDMGIRWIGLRIGIVLSEAGGALPRLLLPFRFYAGGPMGSGKQWYSWIHIRDIARAIAFLIDREDASGPFNLSAPEPVTNREMAHTIGKLLHRPAFVPVPGFLMRAAFGEVSDVVLKGQRVLPARLQKLGFAFTFPAVDAALEDLLT